MRIEARSLKTEAGVQKYKTFLTSDLRFQTSDIYKK